MEQLMKKVLSQFGINGEVESIRPLKSGHINQTNVVSVNGHQYTVQVINTYVFPDADGVMENILAVFADYNEQNPDCIATASFFLNGGYITEALRAQEKDD